MKFHGQQKLISVIFGADRAFDIKLKLFWKQMENINLYHSPPPCHKEIQGASEVSSHTFFILLQYRLATD
jgi:hypothetical protein